MELYVLDSLLRRVEVIDRFESLIWTERFAAWGDFELIVYSNPESRKRFMAGVRLAINSSYRVMTVETVENTNDSEGRSVLKVKGRSIESLLEDRVARPNLNGSAASETWDITETPGNVARQMFNTICVTGALNQNDIIPFMQPGTIFPNDNIIEPPYTITWKQEPETLYDAIKNICELYDLGFRLVREFDTSRLYFNIYTGSDRTTSQTIHPSVVFAPELDNLQNTTSLVTIEGAKNAAYVITESSALIVYPDDVDPEVEGFERRLLLVKADDIKITPSDDPLKPPLTAEQVQSAMIQRGKEELSKHRSFAAFDGEIDQNSTYKYGIHYQLGDLVEIRNSDGETNNMRVTEQIFVSDREGERSYPTLTLNIYINPGSWLTWNFNQVWADMGPEFWSEV